MKEGLLAVGFLLVVAGFGLLLAGSVGQGGASVGGVVFIGPFPIVFGSGSEGWPLALASLLMGGVMVAFVALWGYRVSKAKGG